MSEKRQSTEGPPMYVESLMSPQEWIVRMREFPSTSKMSYNEAHRSKPNSFAWREGMGYRLSLREIENINGNLDYLLTKVDNERKD